MWCGPSWSGGKSPPSAPLEGSWARPQPGVSPSRSDRALFARLLGGRTNRASQTLNLLHVVIFEEITTSGFYLFILYIYFAFVECIHIVKIRLISLCEFHLKKGSQRLGLALNGAHLEGPPWTLSEICWESCYLASIKSRLWSEIVEKKYHSGRIAAQVFSSHFNKTSLSSGGKEPIGLLRTCCQLQERVPKPMETVNAGRWQKVMTPCATERLRSSFES